MGTANILGIKTAAFQGAGESKITGAIGHKLARASFSLSVVLVPRGLCGHPWWPQQPWHGDTPGDPVESSGATQFGPLSHDEQHNSNRYGVQPTGASNSIRNT